MLAQEGIRNSLNGEVLSLDPVAVDVLQQEGWPFLRSSQLDVRLEADMHYEYVSFRELAAHTQEGEDFEVTVLNNHRDCSIVVLAPHGGGIEPFTDELAHEMAGDDFALYVFSGMRPSNNRVLHITSTRFDEPRALALLQNARIALAVHGASGEDCFALLGGGHQRFVEELEKSLLVTGVVLRKPPTRLAGRDPRNICNRARDAGAQIELSRGLRESLRVDTSARKNLTEAVREVLRRF